MALPPPLRIIVRRFHAFGALDTSDRLVDIGAGPDAAALSKPSMGQVNGEFDLAGKANSVWRMLARSNGRAGVAVANGEISKMMMEKIGLHRWEMLQLTSTDDKLVRLRCGVADFGVKGGTLQANALIFDTEVTTIVGAGSIDLGPEKLDLTLNLETKNSSPVPLRSPIYAGDSVARPDVQVDKGRGVAFR